MRAFHLDMKLAQYRQDYLAGLFPRLRQAGYDTLVFEIENKVRLDCLGSAVWCEAYGKAEFAGILGMCREAGLQPIPLIQTSAHLEWLLTHAPFQHLREQPSIAYALCPLKPASRAFLQRYIDEVCEIFGNPDYIHLGGDEATYMGTCPACEAKVKASGKGDYLGEHMGWVAAHALSRGSRPIFWADMVLAHPECLRLFPKEVVWVDWHYKMTPDGLESTYLWGEKGWPIAAPDASAAFRRNYGDYAFQAAGQRYRPWFYADYLLDQGFDVLIAPAASCGGDHVFLPSCDRAANVASAALKVMSEPRLLGSLVTSWAGRMPPLETQWPLLHLPAAIRAQSPGADWQDALRQACRQTFGEDIPDFADHWKALGESFYLAESHLGMEWESGYVGQMPAIPLLFAKRLRNKSLDLSAETEKIEALLAAYAQAARQLTPFLETPSPTNAAARFWQLGVEAIQLRAREYLVYLRAQGGLFDSPSTTEILWQTEVMADRWRAALLEVYQPAGVERAHAVVYGESKRMLPFVCWGRFD